MKIKVQAQHLQPGDIVGGGEKVLKIVNAGISIPAGKCEIVLENYNKEIRCSYWGKYTPINIERAEKVKT